MNYPELVDAAIAANLANRKAGTDIAEFMGIANYLREFATVRIDIGRAVGKTKYIIDHARPWDIIVVPNRCTLDSCYRTSCCPVFVANGSYAFDRLRGRRLAPRIIYVDEPGHIDQRNLRELYHTFAAHPDQTFVLLG